MRFIIQVTFIACIIIAGSLLSAIFSGARASPDEVIVASVALPPTWLGVELVAAPCSRPGGQLVRAFHFSEGAIKGCWTRMMNAVIIVWDDDDLTVFRDKLFFKLDT